MTALPNGSGTTTMSLGELPYNATYYWRARATDGTKESPYSSVLRFTTSAAPAPPPPSTGGPGGVPVGVPKGPGGRAPDNSGLPSYGEGVVRAVAAANPAALANSCQDSGGTWQFMDQVVDTLRTYDTRWGYNGKRGNANDPSKDVIVCIWDAQFDPGPDEGSPDVYIIDIIGGHCGSNPSPIWNDVTQITLQSGTIGKWTARGRF